MFTKLFRLLFSLCGMLFGYGLANVLTDNVAPLLGLSLRTSETLLTQTLFLASFGIIFFYFFTTIQKQSEKAVKVLDTNLSKVPAVQMVTSGLGLIMGMFAAYLISSVLNNIELLRTAYINIILSVFLYMGLGYVGLDIGRRLGTESLKGILSSASQNLKESKGRSKKNSCPAKIFDTSVIIDGRIYDILKTGFLEGDIVIPDFVLVELRHISDSSDSLKRTRGRRGLDILNKIQTDFGIDIYNTTQDKSLAEIPEVDVKLLKLAQSIKGTVVTNDYNLNKVAAIQEVGILNINELANTLKPVVLPGETMQVFVVKEGKESTQGVGYMEDGTMIVVENGRRYIGKNINTVVTSVLQTSAGRMIFTRPGEDR
ncbi:MAG: hypothetical protein HUJ80_05805 [Firmicutes bacterium]|nr:hypothetical protein [Bacillota bacterium]